jgi:DNA-binding PadR family transcriptional regulator
MLEGMGVTARRTKFLGELEHMVLLAIVQAGDDAVALNVLRILDARAGRRLDRGALYTTLDRLEAKRLVTWSVEGATPERGGHRRRRFRVTPAGERALVASREALSRLWQGVSLPRRGEA